MAATKLAIILVEELGKRHLLLPSEKVQPAESLSGILNRLCMLWYVAPNMTLCYDHRLT